jgi:hypothetical protein
MSFWCEIRQTHVTPRCACCGRDANPRPKASINEYGEIVRLRPPVPSQSRSGQVNLEPIVDWGEVVTEPAASGPSQPGWGQVNEAGEIVRSEPTVDWRDVVTDRVYPSPLPPHSAKVWCECRPPLSPPGVQTSTGFRCLACWRLRHELCAQTSSKQAEPPAEVGPKSEVEPPSSNDGVAPCQAKPSRRTVRLWERVVVLILLLLAAIVVYLGWRF